MRRDKSGNSRFEYNKILKHSLYRDLNRARVAPRQNLTHMGLIAAAALSDRKLTHMIPKINRHIWSYMRRDKSGNSRFEYTKILKPSSYQDLIGARAAPRQNLTHMELYSPRRALR